MQPWLARAAADGLKAMLPFQKTLRQIKRKIRPYATNPGNDIGLLGDCLRQIDALTASGVVISGATVVEIGSGWKPILPLMYRMAGAEKIITVDQERLMDRSQFVAARDYISQNLTRVCVQAGISFQPVVAIPDIQQLSFTEMLARTNIDYRAPYDFFNLQPDSADIIVSRDVLEHIPETLLERMTLHAARVLRRGGHVCHTIDLSDHWEHLDKSISRVNFLQYDGFAWKLAGLNVQNFQNRLRRFEHVNILEKYGFKVISVSGMPHNGAMRALEELSLCPRYQNIAHEELAILGTNIVACR